MRNLLVGLFLSLSVFGANPEVEVWSRTFLTSCSYYSGTHADWDVTFRDSTLPWGTKVVLVSAFSGFYAGGSSDRPFNWERPLEFSMDSVGVNTWRLRRSEQLHSRTSNRFVSALQFVFRVEAPGSASYYVNGGGSSWGHFKVASRLHGAPCVDSNGNLPGFLRETVESVQH